ncbi:uncharacterized protein LOC134286930 [Aedes albopictus]|uniref:Integrase catalytic domain-containing protein n=1 Tax=Aedes albopictus TaxID=7160 RepID=A0ABM1Z9T0_AEDAL
MASSPSKTEQCLFCSMSESMSEDCLPSSAQQLKVPDAAAKKRSKKSGQRSDGGSELGASSDVDPIEKQLEEEQLAKEKAFAKQMAARKKLLARQKAWKEEQQRQEQEMRELELQVQREMEEQQLEHEQKLLDAQLAAEQEFVKKREAIRRQFTSSVNRVNALKDQESAVGEASEDHPKKRVKEWLKDQSVAVDKPSTADFRGAYPKGDEPFGTGCSKQVGKPKPMSKVPVITEFEDGSSEDSDSDGDSSSDESFKDVRAESSRRGSLRRSRVADGPGPRVGRIYGEQLDDRAESSRHSSLRRSRGAEGPGPSVGRISREQLAARKAVSQHLPKFRGEAEVWPLFISSFEYTTAACGFSNLENLKRLQDCLQGDALEAVRSRLVLPDSVPDVIADLRNLFGKPEKLLKTLLTKVRNASAPRADRLETFISFGITVKQLCDHLEAAQLNDHLNNPMLVQELVDKLPPSYKLDWVRYKRGRVDSPLRMFTRFTTNIVSDVSEVTEFSTLSVNERARPGRENPRRKEFVHVHESERKQSEGSRSEMASRPCWICKRTDHLIRNCNEFRRMNVVERLREVERQKLCGICLNKHSGGRCSSKIRCMMGNCRGGHHPLLHRVEESVQLQKAKSDCTVIFRMMSVTLYVGKRQYDTVAFLDEGSSATLVDDAVAKRLKAGGTLEPLIVTWTGNINRFENESRTVEISMSAKGSKEKYPLFNTRTVSELQLPKQNIRYAEVVKRYSHLAGVPAKDFPSGVPTILIGLDNLHLFAPLESRVGKPNEPIAVRSKMGWTIYGSEKRRPTAQTYLNLHSVTTVSNQELHDRMREQYVQEESPNTAVAVPEPTEEKRARPIFESTMKRVGDRFETSPMLKENVCQQIEEYQFKEYAHRATDAKLSNTPQATVCTWVQGQRFRYENEEDWPRKNLPPTNTAKELRVHLLLHHVKVAAILVDASRFSMWTTLVRIVACVYRFVLNCRRRKERLLAETPRAMSDQLKVWMASSGASVRIPLKQEEYEKTERWLFEASFEVTQTESLIDERKVLWKNKDRPVDQWMAIERSSPLYKLTPMIDEDGLIQIEGRTKRVEFLPLDMRFPVILPDNHRITQLIFQDYYERSHGYHQAVKNELRLLRVDAVVRKVAASCVWCKVHRCRPETPRMAALPVQRLTPNLRPFSYVGVDYLGPFDVTIGRRTEKRWIALFTCMVTRAVHLEVAFGLTTQSCLMAIHRFIGRRGWPVEFFSDNGTNLRGTSKEVVESVQGISDDCADQLTNTRTKWTFNPPAAPYMGGVWERLVRSVKEALTALDDGRRLTDEILQMAIVEAQDIINSRPLTYVSQQFGEAEALTPNDFLRGVPPNQPCVTGLPPQPVEALRDAFQRSQQLASVIWERWIKEYVPSLNQRTKWFGESKLLRVGEIVYVVEGAYRKCCVRGVIEGVIASGDGRIRQAWVRTSTGRYKRAAVKLARMEIDSGNPEPEVASGTELRTGECSGSTAETLTPRGRRLADEEV